MLQPQLAPLRRSTHGLDEEEIWLGKETSRRSFCRHLPNRLDNQRDGAFSHADDTVIRIRDLCRGLYGRKEVDLKRREAELTQEAKNEAFGSCTNFRECEAVCPKEISIDFIARMNRDLLKSRLVGLLEIRPRSTSDSIASRGNGEP